MFAILISFFGCKGKRDQSHGSIDNPEILKSIQQFEDRTIHIKLTKEIIDNTPDDDLVLLIWDNIYERMKESSLNEYDFMKTLSAGQQMIGSLWAVEAEVNNGGFNQFYFNSSGVFAEMAVEGFKLIGAEKFAELMIKANSIYAENKDRLDEFDDGSIESFSKSYTDNPLNDLDDTFYNLYMEENLTDLMVKYIRNNISQFIQE